MQKLSVTIDEQIYKIEASVFPQNESEFSVRVNGELLTVLWNQVLAKVV